MKTNVALAEAPKHGNFSDAAGEFLTNTALAVLSLTHLDRHTLRSELQQIEQEKARTKAQRDSGIPVLRNPTLDRLVDTRTLKTKYVQTKLLENYLDEQKKDRFKGLPDDIRHGLIPASLVPQLAEMLPQRVRQNIAEVSDFSYVVRDKIQGAVVELLCKHSLTPEIRSALVPYLRIMPTVEDYQRANELLYYKGKLPTDVRAQLEQQLSKVLDAPEATTVDKDGAGILKYYLQARCPVESADPAVRSQEVEKFQTALQFVRERMANGIAPMEWNHARDAALRIPDPKLLRPEIVRSLIQEEVHLHLLGAPNTSLCSLCDEDRARLKQLRDLFSTDKEVSGRIDHILELTVQEKRFQR